MKQHLFRLWAKTGMAPDGAAYHPLIYHILDVAAVAEVLLAESKSLEHLARRFDTSASALRRVLVFCVCLHDIGKSSVQFQMKAPQHWPGAEFGALPRQALTERAHGQITDLYLRARWNAEEDCDEPAPLTDLFRQVCGDIGRRCEALLISAIAGHHGIPTDAQPSMIGPAFISNKPFIAAAKEVVADLADIFAGDRQSLPEPPDDRSMSALSWFLSALIPVSDWIGSNQDWFPPVAPIHDHRAYWRDHAQPKAARAVEASGLLRAEVCPASPARTLGHLQFAMLSPLQEHAFACDIDAEGPHLFLVEDATGAGKTEAAMALTHRLMAAGLGDGFYFALPTMATANAMYDRLAATYRALFVDGALPSLSLAHGKAGRKQNFLSSLASVRASNGAQESAVGAFCSGWIADSRRKALLAQAGAGTIDQALMSVLPLRYQSLRVYGLAGKVLVLDEIHSFDPFMLGLTQILIELHAMLGGSVILMSATLPIATRQKLVDAFNRGCNGKASMRVSSNAYPLLTIAAGGRLTETALPLAAASARRVRVQRVGSVGEGEALAVDMARQGAAVALIRSTVDAAIDSFDRIRTQHAAAQLFHARFLLDDRLTIERDVLARFGKGASSDVARQGHILVATQVVEQSLDLDFDVVITDLAPIDLLIQRAGRLWRHRREGRPVAAPVLHVISPEPRDSDTSKWLAADLPQAAWVYEDVARLWLSAKHLFDAGAIEAATLGDGEAAPAHVRRLVEAVYDADMADLPNDDLAGALNCFSGGVLARQNVAQQIALDPLKGYVLSGPWESDAQASTRLELKPRVAVRLARWDGSVLRPLGEDWSLSELRLTQRAASGLAAPTPDEAAALRPVWVEADRGVRLLVLEPAESGGFESVDGRYRYDPVYGLRIGGDDEKD